MNKKQWNKIIKTQTEDLGTYKKSFDPIIVTLAEILEQRDLTYKQYVDEGSQPVIVHVLDRGEKNMKKNPLLQVWMDLNTQALAMWRDLGLTPAGLKKINEDGMKKIKKSPLAEAIKALG